MKKKLLRSTKKSEKLNFDVAIYVNKFKIHFFQKRQSASYELNKDSGFYKKMRKVYFFKFVTITFEKQGSKVQKKNIKFKTRFG